jgi:TPR repeat protein
MKAINLSKSIFSRPPVALGILSDLRWRYDERMRRFALVVWFSVLSFAQPPAGRPPLKERAAAGDPEAQFTLGKNYEAGRSGLKKDYAEAANWYRKSAEQGNVYAQASLGILYHSGKGLPHDDVQAEMWFIVSAERVQQSDRDTIVEMRDSVAAHLSADQLSEARRLAREWKPAK